MLRDSLVPREILERMVLREMLVPLDLLDLLVPLDLRFIYLHIKRTLKHYNVDRYLLDNRNPRHLW